MVPCRLQFNPASAIGPWFTANYYWLAHDHKDQAQPDSRDSYVKSDAGSKSPTESVLSKVRVPSNPVYTLSSIPVTCASLRRRH